LCTLLLLSDNGENVQKKQEQHFMFVRIGNLSALGIAKHDATGKQIFRGNVKETSTIYSC
jgi:hypothetical protein